MRIELAWTFSSQLNSIKRGWAPLAPMTMPVVYPATVIPVIPGCDVDHTPRAVIIVIVTVRITAGITVSVTISVGSVSNWKTKSNPNGDPGLCPGCRGKRERAHCQTDQKKLFPIHN